MLSPSSIEKVSRIPSPVLIIHGTEDEVIDFSHGLALYERCPSAVEPLWVEGAGHNDIELYSHYPAAERYAAANGDTEEGVTEKLQNGEAGLGAGLALDKADGGEGDCMLTPATTPQVSLSDRKSTRLNSSH